MKLSGIYKIESKFIHKRIYIGSAVNIQARWNRHLNHLRKGIHHSIKLQRHFNKYGEIDLICLIVEPCLREYLLVREQYYIDALNPYFNISKIAGGLTHKKMFGKDNSMFGRKHKAETNKINSEKHKGKTPWNKGKKNIYSEETLSKMKMSAKKRKASEETIENMRKSHRGKKASLESKENMRIAWIKRRKNKVA